MRLKTIYLLIFILITISCSNNLKNENKKNAALKEEKPGIRLIEKASSLTSPVFLTHAGDGSGRKFILEQRGIIKIMKNGKVFDEYFLDIRDRIIEQDNSFSERGLLGLAFHPNYEENGRFFVYYSAGAREKRNVDNIGTLAEYHVSDNPDKALRKEKTILEIDQPESNHNGGCLKFGPEGYLYLGLGDGGGAGDKHGEKGNGQNKKTLLGSIIRINIDKGNPYSIPPDNPLKGKKGRDEIFAWGLRNPWRFSFDPQTGRLFCGDVGQNKYEETDIIKKGNNYGWRLMEGLHCYNPEENCRTGNLTMPVNEYKQPFGISINGGYVYRGNENPSLKGKYLFSDWNGKIFKLENTTQGKWKRTQYQVVNPVFVSQNLRINSFGKDEKGEIYVIAQKSIGPFCDDGYIFKIKAYKEQ